MQKKVVVAMSGGVDSSVAALILKEQGYEVVGITMNVWQQDDICRVTRDNSCCGLEAVEDARNVAYKLGIPHYVVNFRDVFKDKVIDSFVDSYLNGRTPNPCINCNRYIKWESLLMKVKELGFDFLATGHYANLFNVNDRYSLKYMDDNKKDQTYALYNLTQEQLSHTIFPLGEYKKDEIRKLANDNGLKVFDKPDSQDICFVENGDYAQFICEYTNKQIMPGDFIDKEGNVLGRHKGIIHYTIGQRRGLNISHKESLYVIKINPKDNTITLGTKEDVFINSLKVNDLNFMLWDNIIEDKKVKAKIKYNSIPSDAVVKKIDDDTIEIVFDTPQRISAPGQAAVIYDDNYVAMGGTII